MHGQTNVQLIFANCDNLVDDVKSPLSKAWRRVGELDVCIYCFLTSSQDVGVQ